MHESSATLDEHEWMNTYTGLDDVMLFAKPKVFVTEEGSQAILITDCRSTATKEQHKDNVRVRFTKS